MKSRIIIAGVLVGLSLNAFADNSASANSSTTSQTTQNLTLAANNGSAILNNANNSATNTQQNTAITSDTDRISYAMGYEIGRSFKNQSLAINANVIAQGINDGLAGNKPQMSQKDMQDTLNNFQKTLIAKRQTQLNQQSDTNKQAGDNFLASNKSKPGVVTLANGLQYKIEKAGSGKSPGSQDLVTVNYVGSLINGQVFDSSYSRGKPVTFPVNEVIQGWSQALQMMKPGAVWEIYVPPGLAYGDKGIGPIGPNQTLIFKIELISVSPAGADSTSTDTGNKQ